MFSGLVRSFLTLCMLQISPVHSTTSSRCIAPPFPPSESDVSAFLETQFDYVVIGGGTAGVALAARRVLSFPSAQATYLNDIQASRAQSPQYWRARSRFISPGRSDRRRAQYLSPLLPAALRPMHSSQILSDARMATLTMIGVLFLPLRQVLVAETFPSQGEGKMLGGSSGINGMAWNRASSPEYDAWGTFAPTLDWDWNGLLPFFKKSESLALLPKDPYPGITPAQAEAALQGLPRVDGFEGPITASHNTFYPDVVSTVVQTLNGLGIQTNADPQGGNATGIYNTLASVDRVNGVRMYSPVSYYCNQPTQTNLKILLGAQAGKIVFDNSTSQLTAIGVHFTVGSRRYVVNATREIILSAGTVQTPQLLELSGIGNSTILRAHGIPTLLEMPSVGENLQEHLFVGVQWQLKPGQVTFDILRNNATFAAEQLALYNATRQGFYANVDSTVAFMRIQDIVTHDRFSYLLGLFDKSARRPSPRSLQTLQYSIQRTWMEEGRIAIAELSQWSRGAVDVMPNESYVFMLGGLSHPMSRGNVHIVSNDSLVPPAIDVGYLTQEFGMLFMQAVHRWRAGANIIADAQVLIDILKYLQALGQRPPFADIIKAQTSPNPSVQTDDDLMSFVRSTSAGGDHLVGTAAMAPREHGGAAALLLQVDRGWISYPTGVVDSSLRVYGTANMRVVDASIIPLHIAAHTQSAVYAIAEKAAAMIKAGL
ncbi:hypothetical protein EW146_g9944 [Bondarzewia mesenterica]|uniref:Glucose-methanol-choline oxidoreductase N-terminal domain-containing protein n=1 Tax=Bondarzewia mesenterica TaxID=1095465 RepID=A0A4S4L3R1_9AGAM|nr:hypothetical protein EW146_g9944 [Bondarzewia mesenterica]